MAAAANDPGERGGSRAARWLLAPPSCGDQLSAHVPRAAPRRSSLRLPLSLPGSFASLTMIYPDGLLERLPHAPVELPARVAARRLEREAQVHAQRPDRALVADPEAEAVAQVVEREVEAPERHLPRVGEHGRAEPLGHGVAELRGPLDQGAAADRVVVDERPDVPALVAAHRADAPGVEALEERDVAAPAEGLLGAQAEPERGRQVGDQRLVAPPLALEAHEGEFAAQ